MGVVKERESFGKCPLCGGNIVEGEKSFYCGNWNKDDEENSCKIHLPKLIMGRSFDKSEARQFFSERKSPVLKGIKKDGNEVEFCMEYDEEKKEIVPKFVKNEKQESLGKCPKCGKDIFIGSKAYFCSGYKDEDKCDFVIWKEMEGAKFTPEMIKELLDGKTLDDVVCFTKEGKEYKSGFKLNGEDLVKIAYHSKKE
jgi:DNA topoisomerase-3